MRTLLSLCSFALIWSSLMVASPQSADAFSFGTIKNNNGPIVVEGPIECEKKKVKKCKWKGKKRICKWVPGPDCEVF